MILNLLLLNVTFINYSFSQNVKLINAFPGITFNKPIEFITTNDGTNRIFIVEQGGVIYTIDRNNSKYNKIKFLDVSTKVISGGELGLLGFALDPKFNNNGYFYINYTARNPLRTIVSRFNLDLKKEKVDYKSEFKIIEISQPFKNHNGGCIRFGFDNYLYIATGDGGSGGDPNNNAQNFNSLLGKLLRIDVHNQSEGKNYSIPNDNPYINKLKARPEIYALGFRNPWKFYIDFKTKKIWLGDVGQEKYEEIDLVEKGGNYGWRIMEGKSVYKKNNSNIENIIPPIWDYSHKIGVCVTGGLVYYGKEIETLFGLYLFADYGTGKLWSLKINFENKVSVNLLLDTDLMIAAFGEDNYENLYLCSFDGIIYKIVKE
ncbi:MAG: PQQ-dependent sugar dehydrogenase [Candidatus Kapaibacterium sp.]